MYRAHTQSTKNVTESIFDKEMTLGIDACPLMMYVKPSHTLLYP